MDSILCLISNRFISSVPTVRLVGLANPPLLYRSRVRAINIFKIDLSGTSSLIENRGYLQCAAVNVVFSQPLPHHHHRPPF